MISRYYLFQLRLLFVNSTQRCKLSIKNFDKLKTDVLIVGGGIMGCSTGYWLKTMNPKLDVTIVERDKSYKRCSTVLSVGGVRQQFSEKENIQMSMFCGEVLSNMNKYFAIDDSNEPIDVQFIKRGYLMLSSKKGVDILFSNYKTQKELGAKVDLLSNQKLRSLYPWLHLDDIEYGVLGSGNEGWFDPWLLLCYVKQKNKHLGNRFIDGLVRKFHGDCKDKKITGAEIGQTGVVGGGGADDDEPITIECSYVVNATGAWAERIAAEAELACGMSGMQFQLPVRKSKRYVYSFCCNAFPANTMTPMVIDGLSGIYFRRENNGDFICGLSPPTLEEPATDNLDVDYNWFDDEIWPGLYHRVPAMAGLKVRSAWAGFYDYNVVDQNLIVGPHPEVTNMLLCNGSSGHGIQHALAVGRANSELIIHGKYVAIDLTRFQCNRLINNTPIYEINII